MSDVKEFIYFSHCHSIAVSIIALEIVRDRYVGEISKLMFNKRIWLLQNR